MVRTGRFNPLTQGLDIVELGAVFMSLPDLFSNDPTGKKAAWKRGVEELFREEHSKHEAGILVEHQRRSAAYRNQAPRFTHDASVHSFKLGLDIRKKRGSQNSLTLADRRAALERASSKPLLPSKPFL